MNLEVTKVDILPLNSIIIRGVSQRLSSFNPLSTFYGSGPNQVTSVSYEKIRSKGDSRELLVKLSDTLGNQTIGKEDVETRKEGSIIIFTVRFVNHLSSFDCD